MIFDYDVHHGNGTHDIFYDDPDILFVSTHQQGSYPGTGKLTEVGSGDGQHTTINIPLPGMPTCHALLAPLLWPACIPSAVCGGADTWSNVKGLRFASCVSCSLLSA